MFKVQLRPTAAYGLRLTRPFQTTTRILSNQSSPSSVPASDEKPLPKAMANPMPTNPSIQLSNGLSNQTEIKTSQRLSYQIPAANTPPSPRKSSSRWKKYVPIAAVLSGASWGLYTFSYLFTDATPSEYMTPYTFTPFIISNKTPVDEDHYLIELTPKFNKWKQQNNGDIWNGQKLWSVEIKQPQINVVRKYTPLPLLLDDDSAGVPYIRIQNEQDHKAGKLVLYVKKYQCGEVARWIDRKPIGYELELRGPFIERELDSVPTLDGHQRGLVHNVPSFNKPDLLEKYKITKPHLGFFAAGTGIVPVLQMTLSSNPYGGDITVYHSRKTQKEMQWCESILYLLEKLGRVELKEYISSQNHRLTKRDIPPKNMNMDSLDTKLKQYLTTQTSPYSRLPKFSTTLEQAKHLKQNIAKEPISQIIVCGTDAYIRQLAGVKPYYETQGPLGGWLKEKGWSEEDVFKL